MSFLLMIVATVLASAFRPGALLPEEVVKIQDAGFLGHCKECTEGMKYAMVCDEEPKMLWKWSGYLGTDGMIYYQQMAHHEGYSDYQQLLPALDVDTWCNFQDLGNVMHKAHAVVWPIVLIFYLTAAAVIYDKATVYKYAVGPKLQLQRITIASAVHGLVFMVLYILSSVADSSDWNTTAQTVYVFSVISLALYIPGRLMLDQGQVYSKSFSGQAITYVLLWAPVFVYVAILIVGFANEARIFHAINDVWDGVAWCALMWFLVMAVNIPIYYGVEDWSTKKDAIPLDEPEIPDEPAVRELEAPVYVPQPPAEPEAPRALEDVNPVIADPELFEDPEYEEVTI